MMLSTKAVILCFGDDLISRDEPHNRSAVYSVGPELLVSRHWELLIGSWTGVLHNWTWHSDNIVHWICGMEICLARS